MTRRTTPRIPTFAVVGAVNHGKSSVVAALAEDDDVRISAMPGETVDVQRFQLRDLFEFVDTPGFQNARKALAAIEALRASQAVEPTGHNDDAGSADRSTRTAASTNPNATAPHDPLRPFRAFVDRYRDDADFDAECRLLRPVVDGAGIVYVVDASRPLRDIHLCEMEILRRTGAPRLAILNRIGADDRVDAWRGHLDQHFNLVREFDAQAATYADRKDLIESLAGIERQWKDRLREAVALMDADRQRRVVEAAAIVADCVVDCVRHVETERVDASGNAPGALAADFRPEFTMASAMPQSARAVDDRSPAAARERTMAIVVERHARAVAAKERTAHEALIALHGHHRMAPDAAAPELPADDLFAEETWRAFGLSSGQLVRLSTVAGGIAGAGVDGALLGHSFGLGAVIGAVAGAGGAWAMGRRRPEIAVRWPSDASPAGAGGGPGGLRGEGRAGSPHGLGADLTSGLKSGLRALLPSSAFRIAGGDLVVGPYRAENFPWILIDRALCVFAAAVTRSHARRDEGSVSTQALLARLDALGLSVRHWSDAERAACRAALRAAARGAWPADEAMDTLRRTIAAAMQRVCDAERTIGDRPDRPDRPVPPVPPAPR